MVSNDLQTMFVVYGIVFIIFVVLLWNEPKVKKWRKNK